MSSSPLRYQSLVDQVSERIIREIGKGTWIRQLPGERTLIDFLGISRKTLRKSLHHLRHENIIRTQHGIGHHIILRSRTAARASVSVGLLIPESIENLRHFTALFVDDLRALLFESNIRLVTFSGHRFFSEHPENALARLTAQNPQVCWVLSHTNQSVQRWFSAQGIPCIIAGSCHQGLTLPNVDIDYHATCRHAVGAMLRRGHRRLAFLTLHAKDAAGDMEGEAGLLSGVHDSRRSSVEAAVLRHDGTVPGIVKGLKLAFSPGGLAPTAILVNNPASYLTTSSYLSARGLRIGQDVSLVASDDDLSLSHLFPEPARYVCNIRAFTRELFALVIAQVRGDRILKSTRRVQAEFRAAASLADAPRR